MENEKIDYRNHTIVIHRDTCPSNPFDDWDCEPPIAVHGDSYLKEYGIDLLPPSFTRDQIKANMDDILTLVECETLMHLISGYGDRWQYRYVDSVELINDCISMYFESLNTTDKINELPLAYSIAGVVALSGTVTGYSQRDWAEVLAVATPEYMARIGANITTPEQLQSTIDLYGYWAFGDVYGYTVETHDRQEIDLSCWGFYGDDHTRSGLIENAKNDIDDYIAWKRKARSRD